MKLTYIFLTLSLLYSCSNRQEQNKLVNNAKKLNYAENFNCTYSEKETVISLIHPQTKKEEKIILKNTAERKIISLSSTTNGMISVLNGQSTIIGVSSGAYLYDSILREMFANGAISEFGDESNTSLEKIIESGANIVLYSGFNSEFPNNDKLKQLGIITIPIYDWREKHPLGKAEWIKVLGAILQKNEEAENYFNLVKEKYLSLAESSYETSPSVLSGHLYNDIWYAPYGNSYMGKLFQDAGADYVYKNKISDGTASLQFSIESILNSNQVTQFWINPGSTTKKEILAKNQHLEFLPCLDQTYGYSPRMNKYWERSAIEPHLLLKDLISIFHTNRPQNLYFYSKIE